MKTIIHVNRKVLAQNRKTGKRQPPLTVKTYKSNRYAHAVEILGPSKLVYSPEKPLSCGAVAWLECNCEVVCHDEPEHTENEQLCVVIPKQN